MSNIFTEQPWIADTGPIAPALSGAEIALNSRRSALKVLLSVVSIFFMLMIVAYGGRMLYQDWQPTPQISLLWANTGLLLLSSLCLQAALMWARADQVQWVRGALVGAGVPLGHVGRIMRAVAAKAKMQLRRAERRALRRRR